MDQNMKNIALVAVLGTSLLAAPMAMAHNDNRAEQTRIKHARVTHVEPIYGSRIIENRYDNCRHDKGRHNGAGGIILGGIAGSVIAGEIHGSPGSRIAGAVVGSAIGHDLTSNRRSQCGTRHARSTRHIEGYRVQYRYKGRNFVTRTNHHPGKRIRVTESVGRDRHRH